jgi:hypothetical protein
VVEPLTSKFKASSLIPTNTKKKKQTERERGEERGGGRGGEEKEEGSGRKGGKDGGGRKGERESGIIYRLNTLSTFFFFWSKQSYYLDQFIRKTMKSNLS